MTLTHSVSTHAPTDTFDAWSVGPLDLIATAENTPPYLVADFIPSQAVVTFAGESGVGKSFVALSWAAAVATGRPWFGKPTRQARVVYVLGEGWGQFGRRVQAWQTAYDTTLPEDALRFVDGAGHGVNLADPERVEVFVGRLAELDPGLVVIDTFSMLAHIRSENDNAEVASILAVSHRIVRETGATVVLVHHVSKTEGKVRGATAFRGNADTVVMAVARDVEDDDKTFILSTDPRDNGKQRDGAPTRLTGFSIADPGILAWDKSLVARKDAQAALTALMESTPTEPVPFGQPPAVKVEHESDDAERNPWEPPPGGWPESPLCFD